MLFNRSLLPCRGLHIFFFVLHEYDFSDSCRIRDNNNSFHHNNIETHIFSANATSATQTVASNNTNVAYRTRA